MTTVRKFHRYFALVLGIFFFIWIVSGVMILLPEPTPRALVSREQPKADFTSVAIPPTAVIAALSAELGRPAQVNQIVLRGLRERPVYEVHARGMPSSLWDAVTGKRFTISPAVAEAMVRDRVRDDVGKASFERIEKHGPTYPWGPLPAHRIEFERGDGTIAYVGITNGRVIFTDWRKRTWHLITGLHEFAPLNFLFGDSKVTHAALITVALLALVIVITGFSLEFLTSSRSKPKS